MEVNLIFPGQGAQYVGMAKDNPELQAKVRSYATKLDFDLLDLCLNGPLDKLTLTQYTQPAIVAYSYALYQEIAPILEQSGAVVKRVLGHSVGEYSALAAAQSLKIEDALTLVHARGKFMQEAAPQGVGAMIAVLRVPGEIVSRACEAASTSSSIVMPANFNDPTQTVISGHKEACQRAQEWIEANFEGKKMFIPLKVSAPFHSSLMAPAQLQMSRLLEETPIHPNQVDYIPNITHTQVLNANSKTIRQNLTEQITGSVYWHQSLSSLDDNSVFIEVGPGKVLSGLNRKINPSFKTFHCDQEDFKTKLKDFLHGS